jgi:hypothetical protein
LVESSALFFSFSNLLAELLRCKAPYRSSVLSPRLIAYTRVIAKDTEIAANLLELRELEVILFRSHQVAFSSPSP